MSVSYVGMLEILGNIKGKKYVQQLNQLSYWLQLI